MKITRIAKVTMTVKPMIKQTRTRVEEIDICPHCLKEIREKSTFVRKVADTYYTFHRGECADKAPIDAFTEADARAAFENTFFGRQTLSQKGVPFCDNTMQIQAQSEHRYDGDFEDFNPGGMLAPQDVATPKPQMPNKQLQQIFRCPPLQAGDILHVGKYKNVEVKILGFSMDENNQPTVVSEDGTESKVFSFRIAKLLPPGKSNV